MPFSALDEFMSNLCRSSLSEGSDRPRVHIVRDDARSSFGSGGGSCRSIDSRGFGGSFNQAGAIGLFTSTSSLDEISIATSADGADHEECPHDGSERQRGAMSSALPPPTQPNASALMAMGVGDDYDAPHAFSSTSSSRRRRLFSESKAATLSNMDAPPPPPPHIAASPLMYEAPNSCEREPAQDKRLGPASRSRRQRIRPSQFSS
uniref:Uncharacterized protein n=1 Tax=Craspedostauros australis TaxID=1486917 RepID=A0A7R9ZSN2_9STRA|mmetsp:Transcript_8408/g.22755  ORF Transcript_8408/g.22755 Transcript_8408/m.22755 type:complete len:206 (+) Transcript_8408:273-890(+)